MILLHSDGIRLTIGPRAHFFENPIISAKVVPAMKCTLSTRSNKIITPLSNPLFLLWRAVIHFLNLPNATLTQGRRNALIREMHPRYSCKDSIWIHAICCWDSSRFGIKFRLQLTSNYRSCTLYRLHFTQTLNYGSNTLEDIYGRQKLREKVNCIQTHWKLSMETKKCRKNKSYTETQVQSL